MQELRLSGPRDHASYLATLQAGSVQLIEEGRLSIIPGRHSPSAAALALLSALVALLVMACTSRSGGSIVQLTDQARAEAKKVAFRCRAGPN
jgi:hypothetical protein